MRIQDQSEAQSQAKGDYKVWSNAHQSPDPKAYGIEEIEDVDSSLSSEKKIQNNQSPLR